MQELGVSDWVSIAAVFVSGGVGYLFAKQQEKQRDAKLHRALRKALLAEVEYNARQANVYLDSGITAPAYRLSSTVYDSSFPQLIASGKFAADRVRALLEFYSQVRQVNWCLDEIHQHALADNVEGAAREISRVRAKLQEMNSPESRFFNPASQALV